MTRPWAWSRWGRSHEALTYARVHEHLGKLKLASMAAVLDRVAEDAATVFRPEEDYSGASVLSEDGDVVAVVAPALEQRGHARLDVPFEVDTLCPLAQVTVFEFGAGAVEVEAYRVEILDEAVDNPHLVVVIRAIQPLFVGLYQPSVRALDEKHNMRWVHGLTDIHRPIEGPSLGIAPVLRGARFEGVLQSRQILIGAGP